MVTRLGAEKACVRFPVTKKSFLSPKRSDFRCGPPSLPFRMQLWIFPFDDGVKFAYHLYLAVM
jgi:hypothetical protein